MLCMGEGQKSSSSDKRRDMCKYLHCMAVKTCIYTMKSVRPRSNTLLKENVKSTWASIKERRQNGESTIFRRVLRRLYETIHIRGKPDFHHIVVIRYWERRGNTTIRLYERDLRERKVSICTFVLRMCYHMVSAVFLPHFYLVFGNKHIAKCIMYTNRHPTYPQPNEILKVDNYPKGTNA